MKKLNSEAMKIEHLGDWEVKDVASAVVDAVGPVIDAMKSQLNINIQNAEIDNVSIHGDETVDVDVVIDDDWYHISLRLSGDKTNFIPTSLCMYDDEIDNYVDIYTIQPTLFGVELIKYDYLTDSLTDKKIKFEHLSDWAVKDVALYVVDAVEPVIDAMNTQLHINIENVEVDKINILDDECVAVEMVIDDDWYKFYVQLSTDKTYFNVTSFYLFNDETGDYDATGWSVERYLGLETMPIQIERMF